jgi:hypothetical protein
MTSPTTSATLEKHSSLAAARAVRAPSISASHAHVRPAPGENGVHEEEEEEEGVVEDDEQDDGVANGARERCTRGRSAATAARD